MNLSKIDIPDQLLDRLKKLFPDLEYEPKKALLRIGLHRLLNEREDSDNRPMTKKEANELVLKMEKYRGKTQ